MATNSPIEWTESTWNPVTGCDKVSPGCAHCYAERMAWRLQAMGQRNYSRGFDLTLQHQMLDLPLRWRKPRRIFVNSMSDLFHARVPDEFIQRVFGVMRQADWHEYQILTKRSERLAELHRTLPWAPHLWMGVSVENSRFTFRIEHLRETDALVKFGDYIRKWRKGLTIELREDLRLKGTFKDAVKALLRPARLRHMIPTKPR